MDCAFGRATLRTAQTPRKANGFVIVFSSHFFLSKQMPRKEINSHSLNPSSFHITLLPTGHQVSIPPPSQPRERSSKDLQTRMWPCAFVCPRTLKLLCCSAVIISSTSVCSVCPRWKINYLVSLLMISWLRPPKACLLPPFLLTICCIRCCYSVPPE